MKTIDRLCIKTARLIEAKGVFTAVSLLKEFNIAYVMQLHPEQYTAYNSRLDELIGGLMLCRYTLL